MEAAGIGCKRQMIGWCEGVESLIKRRLAIEVELYAAKLWSREGQG